MLDDGRTIFPQNATYTYDPFVESQDRGTFGVSHRYSLTVPLVSNPPAATTISFYPSAVLHGGNQALTGWKTKLEADGMNPDGRWGVLMLGVKGMPIVDNVFGLELCEKP